MRIKLSQHRRAATIGADSNYIRFVVTSTATSHIRVTVIGTNNNKSPSKCTTDNKGTKITITNS